MRREPPSPQELPAGVRLRELSPHRDERGTFTEVFRQEWGVGMAPVQWNVVHTERGVLRGVHVHVFHFDYVVLVAGSASIGLADLRQSSATFGARAVVPMSASAMAGLVIPPGVAHGFLFHEPSVHMYAVTHYWSPADELGCRWDDPDLAIPWPSRPTLVSRRDRELPGLAGLRAQLAEAAGESTNAARERVSAVHRD